MKQLFSFFPAYSAKALLFAFALLFSMNDAYGSDGIVMHRDFTVSNASDAVKQTIDWVQDNRDNKKLPFAVIDKSNSGIFVFDPKSKFVVSGPVLLGISRKDRIDPKTLNYQLSQVTAEKRVTPSGRYTAVIGKDHRGEELLWVDYKYAIALHPVANVPGQNRRTRLKTKTSKDNRITWGCINVSPILFKTIISPMFKEKGGIVYILPEEPANRGIMQIVDKASLGSI